MANGTECRFFGSLAWSISLAYIEGAKALWEKMNSRFEYIAGIHNVHGLRSYLKGFTDNLGRYTIQVRGHPPGVMVALYEMSKAHIATAGWVTGFILIIAASGTVAVMLTVRSFVDEQNARRAMPLLVLTPGVIWIATSMDAMFMGIAAWCVFCFVVSLSSPHRNWWAIACGALFFVMLMLSYGLVLFGLMFLVLAIVRRAYRQLMIVAITAALCILGIWVTGFAWWDGLRATRHEYLAGVSRFRPYWFFVIADLAILAIVVGPAVFAGISRMTPPLTYLVLGALCMVVVADISGMSKAEVERIWLPFVPWITLGALPVMSSKRMRYVWLTAQAAVGLGLGVYLRTSW